MVAYFPSKYLKRIQATFAAAAVLVCLLGSHWIGYAHSISHSGLHSQGAEQCSSIDLPSGMSHGSDVCHLFDALTLAGFAPTNGITSPALTANTLLVVHAPRSIFADSSISAYHSRAPPTNIL